MVTAVASSRQPLTIVGAGLAGSVLAAQLGQRGIAVDVYERRPDPRLTGAERGRSINLALSARGLAAITQLGLRQEVLARALPMRGRTVHPVRGDTAYQPYSAEGTRAINSISRSELNAILLDCAETSPGVRIHFEHRVTGVDPEKGELTLATAEGTRTATADLILANDGAYSAVRASLQFREGFNYSQDFLDHGYKELAIADYALQNFVEMRDSVGSRTFLARTALRHALERASGGRYTSRYELVSFSTVPYADIAPRLQRQDRVLAAMLAGMGVILLSVLSRRRQSG